MTLLAVFAAFLLPISVAAEERALASYRAIDLPDITISSRNPFTLIGDYISILDIDILSTDVAIEANKIPTGYIIDIHLSGYKDDSLEGENYRLLIERQEPFYFIREVGVKYVCARGSNTTVPQTNYCP